METTENSQTGLNYYGVGLCDGRPYLVERVLHPVERPNHKQQILEYISVYCQIKGFSPTYREIAQECQLPITTIFCLINDLRAESKLTYAPHVARSLRVVKNGSH